MINTINTLRKFPASHFLKIWIDSENVSYQTLAESTGLSLSTIINILIGKKTINNKIDKLFCTFFNIPQGYLLKLEKTYQTYLQRGE